MNPIGSMSTADSLQTETLRWKWTVKHILKHVIQNMIQGIKTAQSPGGTVCGSGDRLK